MASTIKKLEQEHEDISRYEFTTPREPAKREYSMEDIEREINHCDKMIAEKQEEKDKWVEMKNQILAFKKG